MMPLMSDDVPVVHFCHILLVFFSIVRGFAFQIREYSSDWTKI